MDIQALATKVFGKPWNTFSKEEKSIAEKMFSAGMSENQKSTQNSSQGNYTKGTGPLDVRGVFNEIGIAASETIGSITNLNVNVNELINSAQQFGNQMGIGRARAAELRTTIADTVPELMKLNIDEATALSTIKDIPQALKTNTIVAKETIVELGATAKFTNLDINTLVTGFQEIGVQLSDVGDKMADAANYAKSVGVNVQAVTNGVVTNLKNLNLFNFENGVQGLAKMAANSAIMGINMDKVFQKAEQLLSPESAIEFSSALQRLGVTSTELLDPLNAMDLAMNNPERLAGEMTKVAQQFTRLKADGTGFEILPGAKLQLREVAGAMGMNSDELAKMAIKSSEFDMKLKQIKFPSFAASEEDKTLIANMSQMKDGKAVVQLMNDKTGEMESIDVEKLTVDQLNELRKDQANQNKTAEQLAAEQLTVLQTIAANTAGGAKAAGYGVASIPAIQRFADLNLGVREAVAKNVYGAPKASDIRTEGQKLTGGIEESIVKIKTEGFTASSVAELMKSLTTIMPNLTDLVGNLKDEGLIALKNTVIDTKVSASNTYAGIGGVQPITKKEDVKFDSLDSYISQEKLKQSQTNNVNIENRTTVDLTNSDGSLKNLTESQKNEIIKILTDKFQNNTEMQKIIFETVTKWNPNQQ
jgi:hypothetical protein